MPTISTEIVVVIISTFGSLVVAAFGFFLTKRYEIKTEWRKRKISYYENLFIALSDLAIDGTDKEDANQRFSKAFNSIALIASQDVIKALLGFHDYVKFSNNQKNPGRHDELLTKLVIEVRKDIGLVNSDNIDSFKFHLIGSRPKN
ncbi:MAG: hypothetical protein WCW02_02325 [Candidatus Buchananbacteria bacterium]